MIATPANTPTRFRKKPVTIEAMHLIHSNHQAVAEWCGGQVRTRTDLSQTVAIETLEGTMVAEVGDWVIKGVAGEFYPCKPEIFEATYE